MALFGLFNNGGSGGFGFFGLNQNRSGPRLPAPINISGGLLQASANARITRNVVNAIQNAPLPLNRTPAVIPPWEQEDNRSLLQRVNGLRDADDFINIRARNPRRVPDSPDQEASFTIFRALQQLRALAEYASLDTTSEASLARLNETFQRGYGQLKQYIDTAPLDKLELFLGEERYKAETTAKLGREQDSFSGKPLVETADDVIEGLTGSETFNIELTDYDAFGNIVDLSGVSLDFSQITGPLTANNVVDYVNGQIKSILLRDEFGAPKLDKDGNTISQYQTRFAVRRDADTGRFGIGINGVALEDIKLTADSAAPSIYVASNQKEVTGDGISQVRISEVRNIDGEFEDETFVDFSGVDLARTAFAEATKDVDETPLDPRIAELRDQFRADARERVLAGTGETTTDAEEEVSLAITDVDNEIRVGADTTAGAIATDASGNVYVVGRSTGSFGNQINVSNEEDTYLTKLDTEGNVIYSRLLGVEGSAKGLSVKVDNNGDVIIAGQTDSVIDASDTIASVDAFVVKFSSSGEQLFRYQLDRTSDSSATAITVDANNDIYVGGYSRGGISSTSGYGGGFSDGLVLKLSGANGTLLDSRLIGLSGEQRVKALEIADDGSLLVASEENGAAVLRKLSTIDLDQELGSINLGALGTGGAVTAIAVSGTQIALTGTTNGLAITAGGTATQVNGLQGNRDGFLTGITDNGSSFNADFTSYIGTSAIDSTSGVTIAGGKIYVAGTTAGTLAGETDIGARDSYLARFDANGSLENIEQIGRALHNSDAAGVAFSVNGDSVLSRLGLPSGTINESQDRTVQAQTSARPGDHFFIQVSGSRRPVKIELRDGDTYEDIARRIRIPLHRSLEVETKPTTAKELLEIRALKERGSPTIELIPGPEGRDLLARIGLEAGRIAPQDVVLGLNRENLSVEDNLGGSFGLELDGALAIDGRRQARFVLGKVDTAIATIQRAYRSLEFNEFRDRALRGGAAPGKTDGTPSARTLSQISNFSTALNRLQSSNFSTPTLSIFT